MNTEPAPEDRSAADGTTRPVKRFPARVLTPVLVMVILVTSLSLWLHFRGGDEEGLPPESSGRSEQNTQEADAQAAEREAPETPSTEP